MSMDFKEFYRIYASKIEKSMRIFLEEEVKGDFAGKGKIISQFEDIFVASFFGGKKLRGILVALGYYLYMQEDMDDILNPCIAYEIFQTSILLKDDIIDNSLYRRGKLSLYKNIDCIVKNLEQAKGITICLSDYAYGLAFKALLKSNFKLNIKLNALEMMINHINNTEIGQILDINMSFWEGEVSQKEIIDIAYYKTAFYTAIGPLSLGAVLAEVSEETIKQISIFGACLGIAFQIQDDILGIFGDNTGKTMNSDAIEGKKTILYEYIMKKATNSQKDEFSRIYGKKVPSIDIDKIKEIMIDSGALDYAKKMKDKYKQGALEAMMKMNVGTDKTVLLEQLCESFVNRDR